MRQLILIPIALAASTFALGQQAAHPATKTAQKQTTELTASPKPQGLTVDSIVSMTQAGLSEDLIVARIRKEGKAFDLSPEEMIKLKNAGVSDTILRVMLDPQAEVKPAAQPIPQPQAPAALVAPVVVQTPAVPVAAAVSNPSGATPGPEPSAPAADPNDPMTPHDSGIYLYTRDRDGNPKMIVLERAAYQGSKTGGVLTSALTYGLRKAKMKAVIPGPRASVRTSDRRPVFYFYFEDKASGLGKSYFGLTGLSNPNQFALVMLEVKKSTRETIIMEFGALGASSGTHAKSMVPFKSERIRPGLYKVVPTEQLKEGEYCFLASAGFGAYGAGAAGAVDIFDFAIVPNQ
ncbi:MAG: hypothetical protein KatS3mg004_3369 [Bryobacteraceae bacterium]|nr:MAG: hypothetical protein KatS3mg004_3369 [Bryobacteraceae bacterium]